MHSTCCKSQRLLGCVQRDVIEGQISALCCWWASDGCRYSLCIAEPSELLWHQDKCVTGVHCLLHDLAIHRAGPVSFVTAVRYVIIQCAWSVWLCVGYNWIQYPINFSRYFTAVVCYPSLSLPMNTIESVISWWEVSVCVHLCLVPSRPLDDRDRVDDRDLKK